MSKKKLVIARKNPLSTIGARPLTRIGPGSKGIQEQHVRHYESGKAIMVNKGISHHSRQVIFRRPTRAVAIAEPKEVPVIKLRPRINLTFMDKTTFLNYLERNFADELFWPNQNEEDWNNAVFDEWISFIENEHLTMNPEAVKKFVDDRDMWEASIMDSSGGYDRIVWHFHNDDGAPINDKIAQEVFDKGTLEEDGMELNQYYDPFEGNLVTHEPGVTQGPINKEHFTSVALWDRRVDLIEESDRAANPDIFGVLDALKDAGIPFATYTYDVKGYYQETQFAVPNEYAKQAKEIVAKALPKKPVSWHSMPTFKSKKE